MHGVKTESHRRFIFRINKINLYSVTSPVPFDTRQCIWVKTKKLTADEGTITIPFCSQSHGARVVMWRLCSEKNNFTANMNLKYEKNLHNSSSLAAIWMLTAKIRYYISSPITTFDMFHGNYATEITLVTAIFESTMSPRCQCSAGTHDWIRRSDRDMPTGMFQCFWSVCPACARMRKHAEHAIGEHGRSNRDHNIQLQCMKPTTESRDPRGD